MLYGRLLQGTRVMVTKVHRLFFAAALSIIFCLSSISQAHAAENSIKYDFASNSVAYNAVVNALGREKIKKIYHEGMLLDNEAPRIAIGRIDLNGDKKDEIIAYFNDNMNACEPYKIISEEEKEKHRNEKHTNERDHHEAHGAVQCPFFIFTYANGKLIQIADIKTGVLKINTKETNGVRDLVSYPNSRKMYEKVDYKWTGRSYQPVQNK